VLDWAPSLGVETSTPLSRTFRKFVPRILIFALVPSAWAQDVPTFSSKVNLVSLLVNGRDLDFSEYIVERRSANCDRMPGHESPNLVIIAGYCSRQQRYLPVRRY
ncbi:MAG TPA: hypothetical protein VF772_19565, partial [Terriglobales bacterium]